MNPTSSNPTFSAPFDNRTLWHRLRRPRGKEHIRIAFPDKVLGYTYIRKNGCSAFKELLGFDRKTDVGEILKDNSFAENEQADHLIFVYRDPIDRMKSLYQNKFIDKDGHEDIQERFLTVMGSAEHSFSRFLTFSRTMADPHCWPQSVHLYARRYTNAIELSSLHKAMEEIIGVQRAEIFAKKSNPSKEKGFEITDQDIRDIRQIYASDFRMIKRIRKNLAKK